jgi:hypothetical protein
MNPHHIFSTDISNKTKRDNEKIFITPDMMVKVKQEIME